MFTQINSNFLNNLLINLLFYYFSKNGARQWRWVRRLKKVKKRILLPPNLWRGVNGGVHLDAQRRGIRIYLTRDLIARILGYNNIGPIVDLKKGLVAPNKRWDPSHTLSQFDLEYQPFYSSRKETMIVSVFDTCYHLIIYMMAHNVIPKKSGHREVRKSDIYFWTICFIIENPPMPAFCYWI